MNRDDAYLAYIRGAIGKIESFTSSMDRAKFEHDPKTQSAVILQLMLIGEMAKKVSEETRTSIKLPWKEIAGFRDRAIHNYFDIDLEIVWQTIAEDLPTMKVQLGA